MRRHRSWLLDVHPTGSCGNGPVRDAALIVAANQQQMFRMASYGSLESYAMLLGKQDAVRKLRREGHSPVVTARAGGQGAA